MKITKEERHIIKHSLGITRGNESYRNHFCTGEGSKDYPHCESLVCKGLMTKRRDPFDEFGNQNIYHVTDAGINAIEEEEVEG
jgi:hypothetical protein